MRFENQKVSEYLNIIAEKCVIYIKVMSIMCRPNDLVCEAS